LHGNSEQDAPAVTGTGRDRLFGNGTGLYFAQSAVCPSRIRHPSMTRAATLMNPQEF